MKDGKPTGVKQGKKGGYPKGSIAAELHEYFHDRKSHASMVARTEVARIQYEGMMTRYEKHGVKQVKWLHSHLGNARIEHLERDGKIFDVGKEPPLGEPNCRCTYVAVVKKPELVAPKEPAPKSSTSPSLSEEEKKEYADYKKKLQNYSDDDLKAEAEKLKNRSGTDFKDHVVGWYNGLYETQEMFDYNTTDIFRMNISNSRGSNIKEPTYTGSYKRTVIQNYLVTQEHLKRKYPSGKITLYRGVDGDTWKKFASKKEGEAVLFECYNVSSWSVYKETAERFAETSGLGGVVIRTYIDIKNVLMSYDLVGEEEFLDEAEVTLLGKNFDGVLDKIVTPVGNKQYNVINAEKRIKIDSEDVNDRWLYYLRKSKKS